MSPALSLPKRYVPPLDPIQNVRAKVSPSRACCNMESVFETNDSEACFAVEQASASSATTFPSWTPTPQPAAPYQSIPLAPFSTFVKAGLPASSTGTVGAHSASLSKPP